MSRKTPTLTDAVYDYLVAHGTPPDDIQRGLITATAKLGDDAQMQIAPDQGAFMTVLARLIGARNAIEIGTFTGYSALCTARGLPDEGRLVCCDVSDEWTSVGKPFWEQAGVAHKIELKIGPALDSLAALPSERIFDMAFIDADKENNANYIEALVKLIRPGGVILVDNTLAGGRAADPSDDSERAIIAREFNAAIAQDPRFDCVMLPIADGLTMLRLRA
ncbi:class I SAM-dependent methyltransferase [Phycisphaeraceae bacterium D3-23]